MPRLNTTKHAKLARKIVGRRGEWPRFEKEKAERPTKQQHLDTARMVREARA